MFRLHQPTKTLIVALTLFMALGATTAAAQSKPLTKAQSKAKMEALKKLSNQYGIHYYLDDCDQAIVFKPGDDNDGGYGVVTLEGKVLVPLEYQWIYYDSESDYFLMLKEGYFGFANRKGQIVIPLKYMSDRVMMSDDFFHNGLMCCTDSSYKNGIIDTLGRVVVPFVYDGQLSLIDAARGLMTLSSEDYETEYLLRFNGDTVMGPVRTFYATAADNLLEVEKIIGDDTLYGLYDIEGHEVIPFLYDEYFKFADGKAMVHRKGVGYGIVDLTGREVVPCSGNMKKDDDSFLSDIGLMVNYQKNMCGLLDQAGNIVVPHRYTYFYADTRDRIALQDSDYGLTIFDGKGNILAHYDEVSDWDYDSYGYPVRQGSLWGFLNNELRLVVPARYEELSHLEGDYFSVRLADGQRAVVDTTGKVLLKGPFDQISSFCEGIYSATSAYNTEADREQTPYLYGYVDRYGNTTFSKKELRRMSLWMKNNNNN